MAFRLPGWTSVTQLRCLLSRCLGYSRTYNTRNLEYYWYATWNQKLFELVGDDSRLQVAPQFPIYYSPDLQTDKEGTEDVDENPNTLIQSQQEVEGDVWIEGVARTSEASQDDFLACLVEAGDDEESGEVADSSFSTTATVAEAKALTRVTDFAILRLAVQRSTALPGRYEGYRICKLIVPLLLEEKRFPSRDLVGPKFDEALQDKIWEGQLSIVFQVALLFRKFPETESVMGIAASGPYWTNTCFKRAAPISDQDFAAGMKNGNYQAICRTVVHKPWSKPLRLDTSASDRRMQTIHKRLSALS